MKLGFYRRLAWTGIQKNRRLYLPYILTSVGVVSMFYIVSYLASSPGITDLIGGGTMQLCMQFGQWVILLFAAVFLCYTNSFLIRRRRREFGLYNMLGMDKRGIGRVLFSESVIVYLLSAAGGLGLGIAVSKLAELCFIRIAGYDEVTYDLHISGHAVCFTLIAFAVIFAVILLFSLIGVRKSSAAELLRSENVGEKPPKANWFLGLAGIVILAAAYRLAVSIQQPIVAMLWFFIAVMMVVIATYLLFISGSVLLCRILQRKRSYYYTPKHFVSVSSMVYRMKRNGAGLASICILCTMVLVMLSSTVSLYFGSEDVLNTRNPRDFVFNMDYGTWESVWTDDRSEQMSWIRQKMEAKGAVIQDTVEYRFSEMVGVLTDGVFEPKNRSISVYDLMVYDRTAHLFLVPTDDYNRQMGTNVTLEDNETMIGYYRWKTKEEQLSLGQNTYQVVGEIDRFDLLYGDLGDMIPTLVFVMNDIGRAVEGIQDDYEKAYAYYSWGWGFNTGLSDAENLAVYHEDDAFSSSEMWEFFRGEGDNKHVFYVDCRAASRVDYYSIYGGLFFLGILLSIVFLFATVLIIYYKQVSEGYEDQARYAIMKKVGMTREEIRRSVDSQILTVFFAPLGMAVLHLAFAFPMIDKLLLLFNLNNLPLLLGVTGAAVLAFAVLYLIIYRATSKTYLAIVNSSAGRDD